MDEKHGAIKQTVEAAYDSIKAADAILEQCREDCEHPEIKKVNYEWAIGHILPDTEVCMICNAVIPNEDPYDSILIQDKDQSI